jgi:hypothetical protein
MPNRADIVVGHIGSPLFLAKKKTLRIVESAENFTSPLLTSSKCEADMEVVPIRDYYGRKFTDHRWADLFLELSKKKSDGCQIFKYGTAMRSENTAMAIKRTPHLSPRQLASLRRLPLSIVFSCLNVRPVRFGLL